MTIAFLCSQLMDWLCLFDMPNSDAILVIPSKVTGNGSTYFCSRIDCFIRCSAIIWPYCTNSARELQIKSPKNMVPITSVFAYYMEPVNRLSMGNMLWGGSENRHYRYQRLEDITLQECLVLKVSRSFSKVIRLLEF